MRRFLHEANVERVALSLAGKRALTASMDNTVKVWDMDAGKVLHTLPHPGMVWNVAISPDGRRVYTGGGPREKNVIAPFDKVNPHIRVFDMDTGTELRRLDGHTGWVLALGLSADASWSLPAATARYAYGA